MIATLFGQTTVNMTVFYVDTPPFAMIVKVTLYLSKSEVSRDKDLHAKESSGIPGQPG
jgi:hypothetical protein